MTAEELFQAIGQVESSRLLRSELTLQTPSQDPEGTNMRKTRRSTKRILRNILVAAIIVSMLAVTAYAVGGFLIFDSPQQMLTAIFGDETGFDHKGVTDIENPWKPDDPIKNPAYDRVPVDETVMEEDIVPHVSAEGKSITWNGYTLTVDAQMHDSTTGCGLITYSVYHPNAFPEYKLQPNGEIWFPGGELISFGEYGESYIIQEKTTDTVLAATYYYRLGTFEEDSFNITFRGLSDGMSREEFMAELEAEVELVKEEYTEAEVLEYLKEKLGDAYQEALEYDSEEGLIASGYTELAYPKVESRHTCQDNIIVDCRGLGALDYVTLANGAVTVTPICIEVDTTDMDFLHAGRPYISSDSIDTLTLHYTDGTDYPIWGEGLDNTLFALNTEKEPKGDSVLGVYMFNRIIDVEKVAAVTINGYEFPTD